MPQANRLCSSPQCYDYIVITHLKDHSYYEDIYDKITVEWARRNLASFEVMYKKWFEIMPEDKPGSFRSTFHLNWIYMLMVGSELVERYDGRDQDVEQMMERDKAKDEQVAASRLTNEPLCQHCGTTGLRITDKMLHHRGSFDEPEEVLFFLDCPNCQKRTACWSDASVLEHRKTKCPQCGADMAEKDTRKGQVITTAYACSTCGHSYKDELDLGTHHKEEPDPNFERDRATFCLQDPKSLKEHREGKWRLESMAQLGKEMKEREDNKHVYDALAELKKPKIAELVTLMSPVLEKAGYIEFSLDKPEIGKDVFVGFSCLDGKSDRDDGESRKTLKKLVDKSLLDTNWRLMSDGISYRLGYLNGRLRAYEREEDLKELVIKSQKLKTKTRPDKESSSRNIHRIQDKDGKEIIL